MTRFPCQSVTIVTNHLILINALISTHTFSQCLAYNKNTESLPALLTFGSHKTYLCMPAISIVISSDLQIVVIPPLFTPCVYVCLCVCSRLVCSSLGVWFFNL